MNYFLVSQNKSYKEERSGGYLWAPQKNNLGQIFHHWTDMTRVKKGDIIFNRYNGQLVSVLIAKEDCVEHERPTGLDQLELWEKDGWMVNVEYIDLDVPITYKDYIDTIIEIQDKKYAPFNKSGSNLGYLFRVSHKLADFFFEIIEKKSGLKREIFHTEKNNLNDRFIKKVEKDLDSPMVLDKTEKELIIKARIGQSAFKRALLAIEKKCRICGVTDERFLVASHIKPWSKSNNQERLDVNNGLLLCPNHDSLFDRGFISFDEKGKIRISRSIDETTMLFLNINEKMEIKTNESQQRYMQWHGEKIFRR